LVQRGQRVGGVLGMDRGGEEARAGVIGPATPGAAVLAAVAEADPEDDPEPPIGAGPADSVPEAAPPRLPAPTCAAEAVIGFPQSMQNREVASFSRPQKEQVVNRQPPRREKLMAREYRNGSGGGQ
jgi:hypothetical protein